MKNDRPPKPVPMASTGDLGALLGIADDAARRLCAIGKIPNAIRIGKAWRIPRATIDAIASGTLPNQATAP